MVFGKIEYLNLLPFHVFMKRFTKSSQQQMSMRYYSGVPQVINKKFLARRVDAAFISSIRARKYKTVNLGIIARKEVQSVIAIPSKTNTKDKASATSNILVDILGVEGEVLIGDRALRYYLSGGDHIDLAKLWNQKYNLPFVFARLSYHKDKKTYKSIEKNFGVKPIKIPSYILSRASERTGIKEKDILEYLKCISYKLDKKAELGLKAFYSKVDKLKN
ncbi:MqnA/MqnD/SBP family protein [Sulfurimonas sp.]|uniref:MqnA/MqnD/SBP family protein n=1 Tax=Sulfurimonas sp. TaxID=2022749 RepID=UPI00356B3B5A